MKQKEKRLGSSSWRMWLIAAPGIVYQLDETTAAIPQATEKKPKNKITENREKYDFLLCSNAMISCA